MLLLTAYGLTLNRDGDFKEHKMQLNDQCPVAAKDHAVPCAFVHKAGLLFPISKQNRVSVPTGNSIRSKPKWKCSVTDKIVTKE